MKSQGWERWLSCWEYFLIFQKTESVPCIYLEQLTHLLLQLRGPSRYLHTHVSRHSHTDIWYVHNFKKPEKLGWDFWKGLHWTLNLHAKIHTIYVLIVFILYECSMFVIGELQNWNHGWLEDFRTELSVRPVYPLDTVTGDRYKVHTQGSHNRGFYLKLFIHFAYQPQLFLLLLLPLLSTPIFK